VLFSSSGGVSSSILSSSSKVIAIISLTLSRKQRFLSLTKISLSLFVSRLLLLLLFQNLFFNNKSRALLRLKILYEEICASLTLSSSPIVLNARARKRVLFCRCSSVFKCIQIKLRVSNPNRLVREKKTVRGVRALQTTQQDDDDTTTT
jgi:hypothetical protein